jgi:hypothetical protein
MCFLANQRAGRQRTSKTDQSRHLAVAGFELINAITNTKITDLVDGTVVYLSDIAGMTTPAFNVKAVTNGDGRTRSMKFGIDDKPSFRIENAGPYALCANKGADYFACDISVLGLGNHTVTATPYRFRRGRGRAGTPTKVSFAILARRGTTAPMRAPAPTLFDPPIGARTPAFTSPTVAISPVLASPIVAPFVKAPVAPVASPTGPTVAQSPTFASPTVALSPVLVAPFVKVDPELALDSERPLLVSLEALTTTKVSVGASAGDAMVKFRLKVQDNGSGVQSGHLSAGSLKEEFSLAKAVAREPVNIDVTIPINQFSAEGIYPLNVYVRDAAGNDAGFFAEHLVSRSFPSMIEVTTVGIAADFNPPRLISLTSLTPTTVDASTGIDANVSFRVVAQDDLSGVRRGTIALSNVGLDATKVTLPTSVAGTPVTFLMNVTIPPFTAPGTYPLHLLLEDLSGYDGFYPSSELASKSFPSQIEVVLPHTVAAQPELPADSLESQIEVIPTRADATAPQLLSLTASTPTTVDLSSFEAAVVEMQLVVVDALSGFRQAELSTVFARSSSSDYSYGNGYSKLELSRPSSAGVPIGFPLRLTFPPYAYPGDYPLSLILHDAMHNVKVLNSNDLAALSFPSSIKVINKHPDVTGPTLVNFWADPTWIVDVTTAAKEVNFQISVQDTETGFERGEVVVEVPGSAGDELATMEFFVEEVSSNKSRDLLVFSASFVVPLFTPPGKYPLRITLYDLAQNIAIYQKTYLADRSFPSFVEVFNLQTDVDTTPPTYLGVRWLHPVWNRAQINVTLSSEDVVLQLVASDTGSGVLGGLITATHRATNQYYTNAFTEFVCPDRLAQVGNVTFNVTIPFERYIPSGSYDLDVYIYDGVYNVANVTIRSIVWFHPRFFIYFRDGIKVINDLVDVTSPRLLDLTAVTQTTVRTTKAGPDQTVIFQLTLSDDVSGLQSIVLSLDNWFTFPIALDLENVNGAGTATGVEAPFTFRVDFPVPSFVAAGDYALSIDLDDVANNEVTFETETLLARGFPAMITVVK